MKPYTEEIQERFPGCTVKIDTDRTLTFISKERIALSPVLQYLDGKGISAFEAKELRPSLEDVFVSVTGVEATKLKKEKEKGGMAK
ncbi:hypothetical protein SDC9_169942 [bioreactor metagenome]|uniref:DUF4162 domain-containing protein n=1 Tax=bioreactor metagenome TaxID=1076179 RepID=A0A645G9T0_9ZZZZ